MTRRGRQGPLTSSSRTMAWPARPAFLSRCGGRDGEGAIASTALLATDPRPPPPRERDMLLRPPRDCGKRSLAWPEKICISIQQVPIHTLRFCENREAAQCCKLWGYVRRRLGRVDDWRQFGNGGRPAGGGSGTVMLRFRMDDRKQRSSSTPRCRTQPIMSAGRSRRGSVEMLASAALEKAEVEVPAEPLDGSAANRRSAG